MLADLRGFTSLSASYPAGIVLEVLNQCFISTSEAIADDIYARVVKRSRDTVAGLEFTSLGAESSSKLQLFVQMLLQGHEVN